MIIINIFTDSNNQVKVITKIKFVKAYHAILDEGTSDIWNKEWLILC